MAHLDISGTYKITGTNQDAQKSKYAGFLYLKQTSDCRLNAEWVINGEQTQYGKGFFLNTIIVINFWYEGEDDVVHRTFKGVVVYTLKNNNLQGFWSEKYGDDSVLGTEKGIKLNNSEDIFKLQSLN